METESLLPHSQEPANCPYPQPDISNHFLRCTEYQSHSDAFVMVSNMFQFIRRGVNSTSPNPEAAEPRLVGCPRLLIQYIRTYPPYLEAVPPSANWGCAMPWWQGPTYDRLAVIKNWNCKGHLHKSFVEYIWNRFWHLIPKHVNVLETHQSPSDATPHHRKRIAKLRCWKSEKLLRMDSLNFTKTFVTKIKNNLTIP